MNEILGDWSIDRWWLGGIWLGVPWHFYFI